MLLGVGHFPIIAAVIAPDPGSKSQQAGSLLFEMVRVETLCCLARHPVHPTEKGHLVRRKSTEQALNTLRPVLFVAQPAPQNLFSIAFLKLFPGETSGRLSTGP